MSREAKSHERRYLRNEIDWTQEEITSTERVHNALTRKILDLQRANANLRQEIQQANPAPLTKSQAYIAQLQQVCNQQLDEIAELRRKDWELDW